MDIREVFKGIAAFFVSLLIFFALLEISLQIYTRMYIYYDVEMSRYAIEVKQKSDNPAIGHVHRPNAEAFLMGVDIRINSDGFRDDEYAVERNEAYRIAVLGDSLTFGWGVAKEATFEVLLEEQLSERRPTEMINFGHGNYNTAQQVALFREKGLKYNPDKVVVFYFINDAEPTPVRSNWLWLSRSRAITFLWSRFRGLLSNSTEGKTFYEFYSELYEDDQPGFIAVKEAFLDIKGVTEERGIELQVIMLPELHNLQEYPFAAEYAKVENFLKDNDVPVIDLTGSFATYEDDPANLWVAPDDAHPNALAHRMIADYSRDFIEQGGIRNE